MDDNRLYHLLGNADAEIKRLRAAVERLQPKADAYDRIGQVLDLVSGRGNEGVYGEDVSWSLNIAMEEAHSRLVREKQSAENQRDDRQTAEPDYRDPAENTVLGRAGVDMSGASLLREATSADLDKPVPAPGTRYKPEGFA